MKHRILVVPFLVFVVLVCWALASPVGSSPDDDFHLSSIWCAGGAKEGVCRIYENDEVAGVPGLVKGASDCYKHRPFQSASCQAIHPKISANPDTPTLHFNKGLYPVLYFKVMHSFVDENILLATFSMRVLNSFLFCLLFTVIFVLATNRLRESFAWTWLVCSVPMALFLIASNNPSSWTITGIGCLFVSLLAYLQSYGKTRAFFAIIVIVCSAMALGSRADAAVYVVITLIVAAVLAKLERPKLTDLDAWFFILIASAATLTFFSSNQGQVVLESGLGAMGANRDPLSVFWYDLALLPELWFGGLGIQPLGWLDTPMPSTVYIGTCGVFFIVVAANINDMWTRKKLAILFILLLLTAIPMWVLMKPLNLIPENVQARYILPLVYLLAGTITLQQQCHGTRFKRATRLVIISLLSISHSVALFTNIKRYVTGLDMLHWNLNTSVEWWDWPSMSPMAVWGIASLSFLVMSYILVEYISGQSNQAPPPS